MPKIPDLLDVILGDASPSERLRLMRLTYRVAVAGALLWAYGFLSPIGMVGFARGNDVDQKIESSLQPIKAQLGAITTQLARNETLAERVLIGQLAQQLRELNRIRCDATDHEVQGRMDKDVDDAQREYKELTGERYPLPSCKDL